MAILKFELDVIGSTCIRRKKPWPRLAIVGESVFLLDAQRISVLYMKSGKTKRQITKLQPLLKNVVQMTASDRGDFIGGLMNSGDLFLWHKSTDTLKHIHGLPLLVNPAVGLQRTGSRQFPYLCVSNSLILVVTEMLQIFVWELDPNTSFFSPGQPTLPGTWAQVMPDVGSVLPGSSDAELSVHAVFSINSSTLGLHCICSFVFVRNGDLCMTTVVMHWSSEEPSFSCRKPTFAAKWKTLTVPMASIGPLVEAILEPGAIVVRSSCDGQLLAVAVNQLNSQANRLAFVSTLTEVITVVDLKAMGTKLPVTKNARSYWIVDMDWSHDDLFLVCITGQGSVCLLPRLGEPVIIETHGFSIDMGPKYFLPLHPLISVKSGNETMSAKPPSNSNASCQQFSVAVHPSQPIILFSDGFMVTAVELSQNVTCLTILQQLTSLSTSHLCYIRSQQKLRSSVFEAFRPLKKPDGSSSDKERNNFGGRRGLYVNVASPKTRTPYRFEDAPSDAVDDGVAFERVNARNGFLGESDFGKIVFGDEENASASIDWKNLVNEDCLTPRDYLLLVQKELVLAWGLASSHIGLWTVEHEEAMNSVSHNLIKFCSILLEEADETLQAPHDQKTSPELKHVLTFFKHITSLLCMDALSKKLLISYARFVHSIIELLLRTKTLKRSRVHTLNGCYLILQYAECHLVKVYSSMTDRSGIIAMLDSLPGGICSQRSKYFPLENSSEDLGTSGYQRNHPCLQRLIGSWQLLFKYAVKHYDFVRQQFESQAKPRRSLCVQFEQTTDVMLAVICRLQKLNIDCPFRMSPRLVPAELFSIEGRSPEAISSWVQTITGHYDDDGFGDVCRCLHAILYATLLEGNVRGAVELVELVVREPDTSKAIALFARNDAAKASALAQFPKSIVEQSMVFFPYPLIRSRAARHLMRSLGRLMAAYFTNFTLFVFPPHDALRIPPLCSTRPIKRRVVSLSREIITQKTTSQHLDSAWTVHKALQYLLLGCHPCDAVWMVHHLGDWRTAFAVAFAVDYHRANAADDSARLKLTLPDNLKPQFILSSHLISIFQELSKKEALDFDVEFLAQSLTDVLLAASFAGVDLTCVLLTFLIQVLKDVVKQFSPIVPEGVYLPSPPIYCPQPVITEEEKVCLLKAELVELQLRHRASLITNLIVLILNSSLVVQPATHWYAMKVMKAIKMQLTLEDHSSDPDLPLQKYLSSKSTFKHSSEIPSIGVVLASFRDLSSLLWLMEVRDKLSLLLRKKKTQTDGHIFQVSATNDESWNAICQETLLWSVHYLPFSEFLDAERDIYATVLSIINEMPASANTAKVLAKHFPNGENFDAEIQQKLQEIIKEWQGMFLKDDGSSSGLTMNLVYCEEVANVVQSIERKRKTFHDYNKHVFVSPENSLEIGSRPFETSMEYANFLGIFFDVCLGKALELASHSKGSIPLLKEFFTDIRKRELSKMPKGVFSRSADNVVGSLRPLKQSLPAKWKLNATKTPVQMPNTDARPVGLFRSMSTGDVSRVSDKKITRSSSVTFAGIGDESSFPLDIFDSSMISEYSGTGRHKGQRPSSANYNNNSSNLRPNMRDFRRSMSVFDHGPLTDGGSSNRESDVLSQPFVPNWILEKMTFDLGFVELHRLVEWLLLWAGRRSAFSDGSLFKSSHVQKPLMQVRVTPKLLIYSLWLIDNINMTQSKSFVAAEQEEVTVAMVQEVEMISRKDSNTGSLKSDGKRKKNCADDDKESSFRDYPPTPLPRGQSHLTARAPSCSTRNEHLQPVNQDDEFEEVAVLNTEVKTLEKNKKKLKKKNSKSKDDRRQKMFDCDSEQTVISYDTEVSDFGTRRLSARDQEEVHRIQENLLNEDNAGTDSESSLAVSSLTGEDLHQTMNDTLIKLTGKKASPSPEQKDDIRDVREMARVVTVPQQLSSAPLPQQQHVHQAVATDLQHIIRDEMRRIMTAQHKGILTMLNSLEGNETAGIPLNMNGPYMVNGHLTSNLNSGMRNPLPREYSVYRVEAGTFPTDGSFASRPTPHLLSSSKLREESKENHPQKFSNLTRTDVQKDRENPVIIQDALQELNWLQNKAQVQPLLFIPDRVNHLAAGGGIGSGLSDGLPQEPNRTVFPAFRPIPPPLLRLPVPEKKFAFSLKFPQLFRMELKRPNGAENHESSSSLFPVLQRNHFIHEPPDRDPGGNGAAAAAPFDMWRSRPPPPPPQLGSMVPPSVPSVDVHRQAPVAFLAGMPFPLLRLPNASSHSVRPFFAFPPDRILNSEQRQQLPEADEFKAATEPSGVVQPMYLEADSRNQGLNEEHCETTAAATAAAATEENSAADVLLDQEPVKLHSGYALTPGLFDEYLAKQNELGSVADTHAKIQLEAVSALQPKQPKAEIVLKKDMYTETHEGNSSGVDLLVGETVQQCDRDRRDRRLDPVLPPDVFVHLRFPETDSRTTENQRLEWKRDFINIVDINDEMLSDIMSSIRDKETKSEIMMEKEPSMESQEEADAAKKVTFREQGESLFALGPDAVTLDLFRRMPASTVSLSPTKVKSHSKNTVDKMNQRISEIAQMAENMRQDFADTRLVVSRLEEVDERLNEMRNVGKEQDERLEYCLKCLNVLPCHSFLKLSNHIQPNYPTNGQQQTKSSQLSADELLDKTLEASRAGVGLSGDELQQLFAVLTGRGRRPQSEEQNEGDEKQTKILEWMKKKRGERMRSFRRELTEKRNSEVHPFEPKKTPTAAQCHRNPESFEDERLANRKKIQLQNMDQRNREMFGLLQEVLLDHQPLLSEPPFVSGLLHTTASAAKSGRRPQSASGVTQRMRNRSPRSLRKPKPPATDEHRKYLELLESCEQEAELILKGESARDGAGNIDNFTMLKEHGMNDRAARRNEKRRRASVDNKENVDIANKTFRLKSFREVVKLQRPEVTRQNRLRSVQRSTIETPNGKASCVGEISPDERQKIYGSTRVPGSSRPKSTVRTIKTYAQRLQEMKHISAAGKNQIQWRYTTDSGGAQSASVQPQLKGSQRQTKRRPTLTYSQQLQRLQAPKERFYSNNESLSSKPTSGLRWHKPLHSSKTYAQQLKELQQPATVRLENFGPSLTFRPSVLPYQSPGHSGRALRRNRPYVDPYSDIDATSDVSGWTVDDDVQRILYGDKSPQITASDTDLSELIARRDGESPLEYTDLVNIEDLEMLDSVSINSCIDWTAVDQIVAEND